ncbi:hypothetical protein ASD79_10055 [Caulobacter sp. Root655]|uniref:hypothetical protein n=1 Tax=Caulobacter sp. Root655 TaxID=1736578 RepID=UPI0006FD85BB|nr:hypothetical protein [Caulobacter sp. Root655]KRA59870.1 hypothetical protein ASD79_10055 [Caulobacter sp. Root655]
MQAMTLSIGQVGIDFFARTLVANHLVSALASMQPPNNAPKVADFFTIGFGYTATYSNINIRLTNGKLKGFTPAYQGVAQLASGTPSGSQFALTLNAGNFTADYTWTESYHAWTCYTGGEFPSCHSRDYKDKVYNYSPKIGNLAVQVTTAFQYQQSTNSWTITTVSSSATSTNVTPNIPGGSVIQNEDSGCFTSQVSDATAKSISTIDFGSAINTVVPALLKSIPSSGDLGNGIVFEWGLGDSGLTFPSNSGISVGITGRVSYKGTFYQGAPPPTLPIPPIPAPTAAHYLQTYVSDYEINALQWAFHQAGLLNSVATPGTIPDPDALKVKTYAQFISALRPYIAFSMQADIKPQIAPTSHFQQVWLFNQANIDALKPQVPVNVWDILNSSMVGNYYVTLQAVEADLAALGVDSTNFATIERGVSAMGMVDDSTIQMVLTILTPTQPQPTLTFNVTRTDILTDLALGIAGPAQTMQFGFAKVNSRATFISSTIPNFPGDQMAMIWGTVGDPNYSQTVAAMGKKGVPLPIMSGFQFLFDKAELSVQQGFVSIKSQVQYKPT